MTEKTVNTVMALAASACLTPGAAWAQRPYDWEWETHPMWWMWGAWGIGMMLIMLLFWGAVVVGIVLAIRWLLRQGENSDRTLRLRFSGSATRGETSPKTTSIE
jgi:uncharacterized membrane protein